MQSYLIVCDNPAADGPEYVGPFPSRIEAEEYAKEWIGCRTSIAEIDPPAMETRASVNRKIATGEWTGVL